MNLYLLNTKSEVTWLPEQKIKTRAQIQNANQRLALNRVGSRGLIPLPSSPTTARAVRHTAVC